MNRIFDPKIYDEYAARHKLETEWSCLFHAEFKNKEGDFVSIGDSRVLEMLFAKSLASIAYHNAEPVSMVLMRVHRLAQIEYEEKLEGGSI